MKGIIFGVCMVVGIIGCKGKKTTDEENTAFFPVISFLKSQVAEIDSSVYPLMKIETVNGISDTAYIKREEFKNYANDFITIPDISKPPLKDNYTESKLFEESINSVALDYTPKTTDAGIRREEVLIAPDATNGDKVKSIIIDYVKVKGDSTVQKKMFWQVAKRFQVVTLTQKKGGPEQTKTVHIIWNDFPPR